MNIEWRYFVFVGRFLASSVDYLARKDFFSAIVAPMLSN